LQLSTPIWDEGMSARKPLHIITTTFLEGNEVLVRFSDGTAAIYEAEELEKLRPTRKLTLAEWPDLASSAGDQLEKLRSRIAS
jgi:hypothetical protein